LVERGMSCLFSPGGITKVFYPDHHPKLPGLTFSATVTNRLSFLLLDFIPPSPMPSSVPQAVVFTAQVSPPVAVQPVPPLQTVSLPSSSRSSHRKSNSPPKTKPAFANPHYLVIDATLPSHVFNDRSLFTTYVSARKLYRTVHGTDFIVEGIGDVHICVVVSGKSIVFRFRNSWHVPSSPHHFFSCSTVVSLGHQVMIAGRSPRMIFSHQKRLIEPNFPKYMPFTRINSLIALKFDPVLSPQPASAATQSISQPAFSLQASHHPFAALASLTFHQCPLPNPQQVSFPGPPSPTHSSANKIVTAAGVHEHVDVVSDSSMGVVLHGGAQSLMSMDGCFLLDYGIYGANDVMRNGGADAQSLKGLTAGAHRHPNVVSNTDVVDGGADASDQMMMSVDVATNGDAKDQPATSCEGPSNLAKTDSNHSSLENWHPLTTLTSSLDSDLEETGSCSLRKSIFYTHHYSPWARSCTLKPRLTSIYSILNSYSSLSFNDPSFLLSLFTPFKFPLSEFSFSTSVRLEQLLVTFSPESPRISVYSIPRLHFSSSQPHNHFSIFPPFHSKVSSLVSSTGIIFKFPLDFSRPSSSPSCLNLISSSWTSITTLHVFALKYPSHYVVTVPAVLDINWSPHNDSDSLVAPGCGGEGMAMIWKVGESMFKGWGQDGLFPRDIDHVFHVDTSSWRIVQVLLRPTASNVLANGIQSDWRNCLQRQETLSLRSSGSHRRRCSSKDYSWIFNV
jgi:hypothetical protein